MHPFALCAVLLAAGCTAFTPPPSATPRPLVITVDAAGRARTELTVLSYNVAGLPWPVRWSRGAALDRIGTELAQLRAAGTAPHVVLLQEAFTARARRIGVAAGYPYAIAGPTVMPARRSLRRRERRFASRRWHKGEGSASSSVAGCTYSEFPPRHSVASAFGADSCAGYDCLANKGVVITTLDLPGCRRRCRS